MGVAITALVIASLGVALRYAPRSVHPSQDYSHPLLKDFSRVELARLSGHDEIANALAEHPDTTACVLQRLLQDNTPLAMAVIDRRSRRDEDVRLLGKTVIAHRIHDDDILAVAECLYEWTRNKATTRVSFDDRMLIRAALDMLFSDAVMSDTRAHVLTLAARLEGWPPAFDEDFLWGATCDDDLVVEYETVLFWRSLWGRPWLWRERQNNRSTETSNRPDQPWP